MNKFNQEEIKVKLTEILYMVKGIDMENYWCPRVLLGAIKRIEDLLFWI